MEPQGIEATIARITSIGRRVSGKEFNPIAVYLKHSARVDHEVHFECSLHFEANLYTLLVSPKSLLSPNKTEGQSSASNTHPNAERSSVKEDHSLVQRVRSQISQSLSEGVPKIFDTAQQLGMSGRTLQRGLSAHGYSFQGLVDESRRQLSQRLLQETDYSLAQIAFMAGYSEQSAFTRAFKRWARQTPRSYRLNVERSPQKTEQWQALSKDWPAMSRRPAPTLVFFCL